MSRIVLRRRAILAAPTLLVGCGSSAPVTAGPGMPHALAKRPVVDFKRPSLEGETIDTKALRGKVLVIKFFADYCIPCRRTLPEAERVQKKNPEALFIGISEDESPDVAKSLVKRYGLSFPVVFDQDNVLSGRYRANEMPVLFVVSKTGDIAWVGGPDQTEAQLDAAVRA